MYQAVWQSVGDAHHLSKIFSSEPQKKKWRPGAFKNCWGINYGYGVVVVSSPGGGRAGGRAGASLPRAVQSVVWRCSLQWSEICRDAIITGSEYPDCLTLPRASCRALTVLIKYRQEIVENLHPTPPGFGSLAVRHSKARILSQRQP